MPSEQTSQEEGRPPAKRDGAGRLRNAAYRLAAGLTGLMPFEMRSAVVGRILQAVITLAPGQRRRLRASIGKALPELSSKQANAIQRRVALNFGRSFIEIMHSNDLKNRVSHFHVSGAGYEALRQARAQGRGAIIVGIHFGQWEAVRICMQAAGMECAGFYRQQKKQAFDDDFLAVLRQFGEPVFERGHQGMRDMIRHLRSGGFSGIMQDQAIQNAPLYDFFGRPARTVTTAADLALKFDLLVVTAFGVRRGNSTEIDAIFEDPIPHSTAREMTELINSRLEARIRAHPDQWYWWYKRWNIYHPEEAVQP